jgi:hypothetical protein
MSTASVVKEVVERLEKLGEAAGKKAYSLALKQVYIDASFGAFWGILQGVAAALCWYLAGKIVMPPYGDTLDFLWFIYGAGKLTLWGVALGFGWTAVENLVNTIKTFLNPEWWAINSLIDEVRGDADEE